MTSYNYTDVLKDLKKNERLPGTHTITFCSPTYTICSILNDIHEIMQDKYPKYKVLAHSIIFNETEHEATTYLTFKI